MLLMEGVDRAGSTLAVLSLQLLGSTVGSYVVLVIHAHIGVVVVLLIVHWVALQAGLLLDRHRRLGLDIVAFGFDAILDLRLGHPG